jgi:hypothetical protein
LNLDLIFSIKRIYQLCEDINYTRYLQQLNVLKKLWMHATLLRKQEEKNKRFHYGDQNLVAAKLPSSQSATLAPKVPSPPLPRPSLAAKEATRDLSSTTLGFHPGAALGERHEREFYL